MWEMNRSPLYSYDARTKRYRDTMTSLMESMDRLKAGIQGLVDAARKTKTPSYKRAMDELAYREKIFQFSMIGVAASTVFVLSAVVLS